MPARRKRGASSGAGGGGRLESRRVFNHGMRLYPVRNVADRCGAVDAAGTRILRASAALSWRQRTRDDAPRSALPRAARGADTEPVCSPRGCRAPRSAPGDTDSARAGRTRAGQGPRARLLHGRPRRLPLRRPHRVRVGRPLLAVARGRREFRPRSARARTRIHARTRSRQRTRAQGSFHKPAEGGGRRSLLIKRAYRNHRIQSRLQGRLPVSGRTSLGCGSGLSTPPAGGSRFEGPWTRRWGSRAASSMVTRAPFLVEERRAPAGRARTGRGRGGSAEAAPGAAGSGRSCTTCRRTAACS